MALGHIVSYRYVASPSLKQARRVSFVSLLVANTTPGQLVDKRSILVRNHFIARTGSRKKTLLLGALLPKAVSNANVLLYRKLQPNPTQFYPVFTPFRRRLKALGNKVAPIIPVGTTSSGMDLQHYLGLSLMHLGGMRY